MSKQKLIPIVIAAILFVIAIFLFINNKSKKPQTFTKLSVTYQNETKEYSDLKAGQVFNYSDASLRIAGKEEDRLIIVSSINVTINKKETNEFEIKGGKEYNICIHENDCLVMLLNR